MRVFHNDNRPNYEEIIRYGPSWLTEFKEMDANYKYAGWTLDLMAHWLERVVRNVFPYLADEETISDLEKLLRIEHDSSATLEERRNVVASYYYFGFGKLSRTSIINFIKAYTGCDSDLTYDSMAFLIHVDGRGLPVLVDDKLLDMINRRMPAHLGYSIQIEEETSVTEYVGIEICMTPHIVIDTEELTKAVLSENVSITHIMLPTYHLV